MNITHLAQSIFSKQQQQQLLMAKHSPGGDNNKSLISQIKCNFTWILPKTDKKQQPEKFNKQPINSMWVVQSSHNTEGNCKSNY